MKVIDAYNDPYQEIKEARIKRKAFVKLKSTDGFKHWRNRQQKIQEGKCAWCLIELDREGIVTHIDHVTPLRFEGQNEYKNFVLSCRRCNQKKWIQNRFVYPQWIKDNDERLRSKQQRKRFYSEQINQAKELLYETEAEQIRWILEE